MTAQPWTVPDGERERRQALLMVRRRRQELAQKSQATVHPKQRRAGYCPHTPTEKQKAFLDLTALEAFFGGAAGGGKSDALLMAALQHIDRPDYAALLLRRSYADLSLPGALMDRAADWWRPSAATWRSTEKTWAFPSGATITFGYLETENDKYRYQGAEFQFCIAEGTPILLADGSYRPVEEVRIGDRVATLEGPRRVTRVSERRARACWRLIAGGAETVVSDEHRILTEGGWVCPEEQIPSVSHAAGTGSEVCSGIAAARGTQRGFQPSDWRPEPGRDLPRRRERRLRANVAYSADCRSGSEASDDSPPEGPQPLEWSVRAVLLERALPLTAPGSSAGCAPRGSFREPAAYGPPGSARDYHDGSRCDGEPPHAEPAADPERTPSPTGVEAAIDDCRPPGDGRTHIPSRSRPGSYRYFHPYTKRPLRAVEGVRLAPVCMVPEGVRATRDLTVESASHYISFGGIVSQNCGFDELSQFTESQYRYLLSRLRRPAGSDIPLRARSASNPGGVGHEWVKRRFIIEGPGEGRVFVPARLDDNPHLDREQYRRALEQLDHITRAQLLAGDWDALPEGGLFKRAWFSVVDTPPVGLTCCRYWDLAATEQKAGTDPDYTVGMLVGKSEAGRYTVLDVQRVRESAATVERLVRQCAEMDGRKVGVYMEQEPGASGKAVTDRYGNQVLSGWEFRAQRTTGNKVERAKPVSAQAEAGNVAIVSAPWNSAFLDEAAAFPADGVHDDQVDCLSGAMAALSGGKTAKFFF